MAIKVLVADDVKEMRTLLRLAMTRHGGFEVVAEAGDGLSAVELTGKHKPDVVLLDLAMPGMDGLEAIPLIHRALPGVRILVLSGFSSPALAEKAKELCATDYIEKGESPTLILQALERAFKSPSKHPKKS